jgi:UDP-N-acetylmuramate: L-alanyl-gamma-D-glutamyl-meso-diaminopimelate ligase
LEIKRLDPIDENAIKEAFGRQDLKIFTEPKSFHDFLKSYHFDHHLLLMMSSGNYAGLDFDELKKWVE